MPETNSLLEDLGFVYVEAGKVLMGTPHPLPCPIQTHRSNESYVTDLEVEPFWISRWCVSNAQYEAPFPGHLRTALNADDTHPVVDVTYHEAITFCRWMTNRRHRNMGITFDLPTEPEWVLAAAPYGWAYPYTEDDAPLSGRANTVVENIGQPLAVDDGRYGGNHLGLLHMAGNVQEITKGIYQHAPGAWGSPDDGAYFMTRGGSYGNCAKSARVCCRFINDIAGRSTRIGFRLVARRK